MSNLTEALNRILNWLQQNQWIRFKETQNSASLLKPGLSRAAIDSLSRNSNLELPEEIYELYQWRNGDLIDEWDCIGLFDIYHDFHGFGPWGFIPFQGLVNVYMKKANTMHIWSQKHFLGFQIFRVPQLWKYFAVCQTDV